MDTLVTSQINGEAPIIIARDVHKWYGHSTL